MKENRGTPYHETEITKSVVKCVNLGRKQSIALSGHRNDSSADDRSNKGNFLALLEFQIDTSNDPLKKRLETCHANARYSSKTIQNKTVSLIGKYIRESVVQELKEAKFFLVLCNEVTDNVNLEKLSFVLRFVGGLGRISGLPVH